MKKLLTLLTVGVLLSLTACYSPEEIEENRKTAHTRAKEIMDIPNVGKVYMTDVLVESAGVTYRDRIYYIDKTQPITVIQRVGKADQSIIMIDGVPYVTKETEYKTGY